MAVASGSPAALNYEDSLVRLSSLMGMDNRGLVLRFDKQTYILTDGPNSGNTVEYWTPVFASAATISGTVAVDSTQMEDAVAASGAKGAFSLLVRRDTDAATAANGDYHEQQTDSLGATKVNAVFRAGTATQSSVNNSASSVTALAANTTRRGATIFNDDTAVTGATVKLKLGATASSTSFSVIIAPQGYYEVPFGYTGIIDAIASAATGALRITELT